MAAFLKDLLVQGCSCVAAYLYSVFYVYLIYLAARKVPNCAVYTEASNEFVYSLCPVPLSLVVSIQMLLCTASLEV